MNKIKTGWKITVNVLPIDDLITHEGSSECVCGPREEFYEHGAIFVHNSLDNREAYENYFEKTEEDAEC